MGNTVEHPSESFPIITVDWETHGRASGEAAMIGKGSDGRDGGWDCLGVVR